ncbi:hypothetical protein GGI04_001009 [Coemansia thaxteri]|uniref:Ribosomal protein/NADH dehydrogenase domain-containing protein n=1 Tax=Coemansia thaxteri TaxID=2663907 RepID=A0A9W8EJ84_9FUNG|nr:hypothetical protein H4R26_001517 [Coemansia thaxteri]KAJ2008777.1 hypothetical protein GGI04_001009 [Coemansia thaxteri]KAJ2472906.1 hypothetical protein GGI02_001261 [Coemansia sp. RSA 2322]KAJ2486629.1 hypothetical protein EV174_001002 [Coemansia sp. RSA 2320]
MKIGRIMAILETGQGAVKVSPAVESVTLTLSQRTRASGARHFWREHLRRLQFANPKLVIEVNYPREPCMPKLEIKFANTAPHSFSVAGLRSDEIYKQFASKATS